VIPFGKMIPRAKALIIPCFNTEILKDPEFIQQDMGACVQNILLAAHAKGIGSVRVGIYGKENQDKSLNSYLNIPEHLEIFNIIALGYPNTETPLRNKECVNLENIHWL
jgi:nitroreductase